MLSPKNIDDNDKRHDYLQNEIEVLSFSFVFLFFTVDFSLLEHVES